MVAQAKLDRTPGPRQARVEAQRVARRIQPRNPVGDAAVLLAFAAAMALAALVASHRRDLVT